MPSQTLKTLVLAFGLIGMGTTFAQLPGVTFEVITTREGLPVNTVLSAVRDRDGFMWFGTRQCPVRYTGAAFQRFPTPETYLVTGMAVDPQNALWVASDRNGVCRIDPNTLAMECMPENGHGSVETTGDFFIDSQGNGWYSTRDGVARINLATRQRRHYSFHPSTFVWMKGSFAEGNDGTLWVVGRDNGLFRYDRDRDSLMCVIGAESPTHRGPDILMAKACVDAFGIVWVGTYNRGLIRYDPMLDTYTIMPTGRRSNAVLALAEGTDENGKHILWVGDDQGLGVFRPEQQQFYFFPAILSRPYGVNYIYRDPDEIVWVCTSDGIIKYHPKSNMIQSIQIPEGLVAFPVTVNTVMPHPLKRDIVYLGLSHTGMLRWDRTANTFSLIRYPDAPRAETNWMIARNDGNVWIGVNRWDYARPGIFVFNLGHEAFVHHPVEHVTDTWFSVPFFMYGDFDDKGRLWAGNSDEGIRIANLGTQREVTPWSEAEQEKLVHDNNLINDILLDHSGNLWVGTFNGIYRDSANHFIRVDSSPMPPEVQDPAVNTLLEDRHGNLWAARWGSVTRTSPAGDLTAVLTMSHGFYDRELAGLAEDYLGCIWIGNYEGLYCCKPSTGHVTRFSMNDGLISNNTLKRLFISRDGKELFIGQKNGLNIVKVDQVMRPFDAPAVAISSFRVHEHDRYTDFSKPIELTPADNAFRVDFIALNYRKEQDNAYAYYLEGFEKQWNYSGTQHVAYYTNLSPGDYTLHLKAGDALGNWNPETLKLNITVLPAYYETAWFRILAVVVVLGLLYGLYRYRINQLLRLQRVRNRISADLHDELGSSLSGIGIMGTLARNGLPAEHPSLPFVDRMVEEVQVISGSLDDIVWNISPKNDALSSLIARMTRYASELFEAKQISYDLFMPESHETIRLSMDQRRNFYLAFKEAVNNLIKYSQCTHATVSISVDRHTLIMVVRDNGIGFNPHQRSDRNGLENLRSRAKSLGGTIDIESKPGTGTTIRFQFTV